MLLGDACRVRGVLGTHPNSPAQIERRADAASDGVEKFEGVRAAEPVLEADVGSFGAGGVEGAGWDQAARNRIGG